MREPTYTCLYGCPVEATADLLGGKWKAVILYYLFEGPKRFNELRRLLSEVTQRMLILHLRELEQDGIVVATHVRHAYNLHVILPYIQCSQFQVWRESRWQ
jgi:DNA-binding HxlR family transcriptional regulator